MLAVGFADGDTFRKASFEAHAISFHTLEWLLLNE